MTEQPRNPTKTIDRDGRGKLAYVAVSLAFVVAVGVATYAANTANDSAKTATRIAKDARATAATLKQQAATIAQLRRTQRASCANFETLKDAVNKFHGTLRTILETAEKRAAAADADPRSSPQLKRASANAVRVYKQLLANTKTVAATCAQKPVHPPKKAG